MEVASFKKDCKALTGVEKTNNAAVQDFSIYFI